MVRESASGKPQLNRLTHSSQELWIQQTGAHSTRALLFSYDLNAPLGIFTLSTVMVLSGRNVAMFLFVFIF